MKFLTTLSICTAPALLLLATSAMGQSQGDVKKADKKLGVTIAVNALSIDSQNTTDQGLGGSAFGLDIAGNYYVNRNFVASLGFGVANIKDNEEFSQQVIATNLFGSEIESAKSTVRSFPLFAEVSYHSLTNSANGLGYRLGAGLTHFVGTERSISKCSDCRSEDLSIDGGPYLTAGVIFQRKKSLKLGVSARQYVSGDVKSGILFWIETR